MNNLTIFIFSFLAFSEGIPFEGRLIGQGTPSPVEYRVHFKKKMGYVTLKGEETAFKMDIPPYPHIKQTGDKLLVWSGEAFNGLSIYDSKGQVQQVTLEASGTLPLIEVFNGGYLSIWYNANSIHIHTYDAKGARTGEDAVSREMKKLLNARGLVHSVFFNNQLWVWCPNHAVVLALNERGKIEEEIPVPMAAYQIYDPFKASEYLGLEEKGDAVKIQNYVAANKGLVVKMVPASFILFHNEPALVFNIHRLDQLDGKTLWNEDAQIESLGGKTLQKIQGSHISGLTPAGLLGTYVVNGAHFRKTIPLQKP